MTDLVIKNYEGWEDGDLDEYLKVGDIVDEKMVDYFIDVLPPAWLDNSLIQMGEIYSHVEGRPTFSTLVKTENGWMYAGNCFTGRTEDKGRN